MMLVPLSFHFDRDEKTCFRKDSTDHLLFVAPLGMIT